MISNNMHIEPNAPDIWIYISVRDKLKTNDIEMAMTTSITTHSNMVINAKSAGLLRRLRYGELR